MQTRAPSPPSPLLESTLTRYLSLAHTCHALFAATLHDEKHRAQRGAMDALLRALEGAQGERSALPH